MVEKIHPFLDAYLLHDSGPALVPAHARRMWMDEFDDRHPYRCLPLTMANSSGWELLCPFAIDVEWNGGKTATDLQINSPDKQAPVSHFAQSHFRRGILTFHTGYLFRTPPNWAVWCMGTPNWPKDGIYPLSGLVETDWLPFPFTMNWQMTRPGKVQFDKDEPFCFITLSEHRCLESITPKIKRLVSNPTLHADYQSWSESRSDFIQRLARQDTTAISEGWQRHYMRGTRADGKITAHAHDTRRRLAKPQDLTGKAIFLNKPKR